ncbi:putative ribonuclease [Auxenochlorella protothecoides]|uniref:Putative ribonuclease n=1 Tax=Auxenochlorella protothecoides TaxID=3075 RepID=A0A087SHZ4_AUXPR|nr:putative ribonuclease [Auxenochlorella protothecoides]KFM25348.1 putative ribonuclease [Auxenochlorella protothecoides]
MPPAKLATLLRQLDSLSRLSATSLPSKYMPHAGFSWAPFGCARALRTCTPTRASFSRSPDARPAPPCLPHGPLLDRGPWRHARRMSVEVAAARHSGGPQGVNPGALVQFRRGEEFHLGRVVRPNSRGWQVQDASGALYGIRAQDIAYRLPGEDADLAVLTAEVEGMLDPALLALGWEVSEASALYSPPPGAWAAGPHAERMATLAAYALGRATVREHARAVNLLHDLHASPTAHAAGALLQEVGALPADVDLALLAAGTTEVDDGLAVEATPDGRLRVWVHVADPARWVQPGSELAREAARRAKSVYLPNALVPMFPLALAEGPFSLTQDVAGPALSFGFVLNEDGSLDADSIEACPSIVCPSRRLSYDDVDSMLLECTPEQEPDMFRLHAASLARVAWRTSQGAIQFSMPEASIGLASGPDGRQRVTIQDLQSRESASRLLVAEMMIAAGEAAALLGPRLGVALPYRGQPAPVLPSEEELGALPAGLARDALLRSRMMRSAMGVERPLPHAGLGLPGYVQALAMEVDTTTSITQAALKIEREVESRWVARYFEERLAEDPGSTWSGTMLSWLRQELGLAKVALDYLGLEMVVRVSRPVTPGTRFALRCTNVDRDTGVVQLEAGANVR